MSAKPKTTTVEPQDEIDDIHAWLRNVKYVPGRGNGYLRVGKKAAGRVLDGREWNEFPTIKS